jgi:hypothetical protein
MTTPNKGHGSAGGGGHDVQQLLQEVENLRVSRHASAFFQSILVIFAILDADASGGREGSRASQLLAYS